MNDIGFIGVFAALARFRVGFGGISPCLFFQ